MSQRINSHGIDLFVQIIPNSAHEGLKDIWYIYSYSLGLIHWYKNNPSTTEVIQKDVGKINQ